MMKFINSLKHIDIIENLELEKIYITSDLHLFHTNINVCMDANNFEILRLKDLIDLSRRNRIF